MQQVVDGVSVRPSNNADKRTQVSWSEIAIDGVPIPVRGSVRKQDLARFQSKITLGDYSFDSDPLLSTYNISSLTGGIGNEHLKEGVDDETYWTGTLETRYPGQITLLPKTWTFDGPLTDATNAYPLGDFPSDAPSFWAAFDSTLARWNIGTQTFDQMGNLTVSPVGKAVEFEDKLYIPLGGAGYATVDRGTYALTVTDADNMHVRSFTIWDNKLAALTDERYVRLKIEDAAWEAENANFRLPSASVPKHLVVYVNQQGAPTLYVVTNQDVYAYGRDETYLYRTQLQFPPHPDNGRAAANWRGESLYVSVGLGIHSYNGGIIGSMGPDGRYGLPAHLRGVVTDLAPEYNALLCLVQGMSDVDPGETQDWQMVDPMYEQNIRPYVERSAHAVLLRHTGSAWHPVWESDEVGLGATWVIVSRADNGYRMWWGYDGQMLTQKLPYAFQNPKQGLRAGVNEFENKGALITGWMDADMVAFDKLASHMEILLDDPLDNRLAVGKVTIRYQYDNNPGWYHLGDATHIGMTCMPFNISESEGSSGFSWGLPFRRIRFEVSATSDHILQSPVIRSVMLKFLKIPISQLSFQFDVDLDYAEQFKNSGAGDLSEFIRKKASSNRMSELLHRTDSYRVRVSQTQATDQTGYDLRSTMTVSAVEVKIPEHDWILAVDEEGAA
jgi:hypothetical protein